MGVVGNEPVLMNKKIWPPLFRIVLISVAAAAICPRRW